MDPILEKNLGYPERVTDIRRYIKSFAIYYVVVNIAVAVMALFLDPPGSTSILVYIFTVGFALQEFVKKEKRVPEPREETQLINGYFFFTLAFSAIVLLIMAILTGGQMDEEFRSAFMAPLFWIILVVIIALFYGLTILMVKKYPSFYLRSLERKGKL